MGSLAHEPRVSMSWVGLDLEISQELGHRRKKEERRTPMSPMSDSSSMDAQLGFVL